MTERGRPARHMTSTAFCLWFLNALFCLRVLGQVLVEYCGVSFLPPSKEWASGLIPYPLLLLSQVLIIVLLTKVCLDFTRQRGWAYQPRRRVGSILLAFGGMYLTGMVIRYILRMTWYPTERWTGGLIPIFFHWVLAAIVLIVGAHHWRRNWPRSQP